MSVGKLLSSEEIELDELLFSSYCFNNDSFSGPSSDMLYLIKIDNEFKIKG